MSERQQERKGEVVCMCHWKIVGEETGLCPFCYYVAVCVSQNVSHEFRTNNTEDFSGLLFKCYSNCVIMQRNFQLLPCQGIKNDCLSRDGESCSGTVQQ